MGRVHRLDDALAAKEFPDVPLPPMCKRNYGKTEQDLSFRSDFC
jgi:hypothetical protein